MEKNYSLEILDIFKGWGKLIRLKLRTKTLSPLEQEVILERTKICNDCSYRKQLDICGACGCYLPAKIVLMNQKCKKGLWLR